MTPFANVTPFSHVICLLDYQPEQPKPPPTNPTHPIAPSVQNADKPRPATNLPPRTKLPFLDRMPSSGGETNFHLVFEFLLGDEQALEPLDKIAQVLSAKRLTASLTARNFELAVKFIGECTESLVLDRRKVLRSLEFMLTFLGSFFDAGPVLPSVSPAVLRFRSVHYLQNLYGCGLELEKQVRTSFYRYNNTVGLTEFFYFGEFLTLGFVVSIR